MRTKLCVLVTLIVLFVAAFFSFGAGAASWEQFHKYVAHTGYSSDSAPSFGNLLLESAGVNSVDALSSEALLVANFSANVTSGYAPLTVQFTDSSTGATSWAWDFDNDSIVDSTQSNATYTYELAGVYTVNLTVAGPDGNDSEVKADYITVSDAPPVVQVDAAITGNTIPASMTTGESILCP